MARDDLSFGASVTRPLPSWPTVSVCRDVLVSDLRSYVDSGVEMSTLYPDLPPLPPEGDSDVRVLKRKK